MLDGSRTTVMSEGSARLRADITPRLFLAVGYRFEVIHGSLEHNEYDAHVPTFAVGLRLGGSR